MGKFLIAIALIFATLCGCSSSGCLDNGSAIPLAGFYSSTTGKEISLGNLQITGFETDSILLGAGSAAQEVYLPMRSTQTSTSWVLTYKQDGLEGVDDRITFEYESIPFFASEECGAMYNYRITKLDYTKNLIDSVVLTSDLITNADIETIRIYFRTAEEGAEQ